jgi:hypothetical protein
MQQRSYQDILLLKARNRASPNVLKRHSIDRTAPCCSASVPWVAHTFHVYDGLHIAVDIVSYESA